jgi:N-acetylglucosamine-6-sulfatase
LALITAPAVAHAVPPNIVVVVTDDQTAASFNRATMPATKRLLADRGTTFANAVVTTPICCPSRATFLTGQYGHNNGVTSNVPGYRQLIAKTNILPSWLQRAGYRTAHFGKYLNGYTGEVHASVVPAGWDHWWTLYSPNRYYDYNVAANGDILRFHTDPEDYVTRILNARAASYIRDHGPQHKPLYVQVDHVAPHEGSPDAGRCEMAAIPDPIDYGRFVGAPLPAKPSINEADMSDKPGFMRRFMPLTPVELADAARQYGCALASLRAVDRGVRQIVRALKEVGELDDTVIVFTSDNGLFYAEHRIRRQKIYPYEEAIRVPLVMRVPKLLLDGRGRPPRLRELVANVDLAPTILALAGAEPCRARGHCRTMDGRSLLGLLRGRQEAWPADRAVLIEYALRGNRSNIPEVCEYGGLRLADRLYVEHTSVPNDITRECEPAFAAERYDLDLDPFQLENLGVARRPALTDRLARLRRCAGIEGRDPHQRGHPFCE